MVSPGMAEKAERQRFIAQCIQALEKNQKDVGKIDNGGSAQAAAKCYQKLQYDFPDLAESEAEALLKEMR